MDQITIQAGVDAAQPGDVVLVLRGIYKEAVVVSKSFIRIVAEDKGEAILEGRGLLANGFLLHNVTDVEICGFKIQNYILNGIFVMDGGYHRLLENCCESNGLHGIGLVSKSNLVWKNMLRQNSYAGTAIDGNDNWLIDNQITGNHTDGIFLLAGSHNSLLSNIILRSVHSAGLSLQGSNTLIYENEFKNNLQGIVIYTESDISASDIMDNNEIVNNSAQGIVWVHKDSKGDEQELPLSPSEDKLLQYISCVKELLELAEQTLDQIPERQLHSHIMNIVLIKQYVQKLSL